jgi:nitroreductase
MQAESVTMGIDTDHNVVLRAIRDRRSIGKCSDEVPSPELIRQVLEAGTWAPNHRLTEPWRFVVLSGDARDGLGEAMGEAAARKAATSEAGERARSSATGKPLRAPYVVAVYAEPNPAEMEIEEIAATAAAAQNMLLAAHALGLAAMWRSGDLVYSPEVRNYLRMPDSAIMLGVIYIGFPAMESPTRERTSVDSVTTWWDTPPAR